MVAAVEIFMIYVSVTIIYGFEYNANSYPRTRNDPRNLHQPYTNSFHPNHGFRDPEVTRSTKNRNYDGYRMRNTDFRPSNNYGIEKFLNHRRTSYPQEKPVTSPIDLGDQYGDNSSDEDSNTTENDGNQDSVDYNKRIKKPFEPNKHQESRISGKNPELNIPKKVTGLRETSKADQNTQNKYYGKKYNNILTSTPDPKREFSLKNHPNDYPLHKKINQIQTIKIPPHDSSNIKQHQDSYLNKIVLPNRSNQAKPELTLKNTNSQNTKESNPVDNNQVYILPAASSKVGSYESNPSIPLRNVQIPNTIQGIPGINVQNKGVQYTTQPNAALVNEIPNLNNQQQSYQIVSNPSSIAMTNPNSGATNSYYRLITIPANSDSLTTNSLGQVYTTNNAGLGSQTNQGQATGPQTYYMTQLNNGQTILVPANNNQIPLNNGHILQGNGQVLMPGQIVVPNNVQNMQQIQGNQVLMLPNSQIPALNNGNDLQGNRKILVIHNLPQGQTTILSNGQVSFVPLGDINMQGNSQITVPASLPLINQNPSSSDVISVGVANSNVVPINLQK